MPAALPDTRYFSYWSSAATLVRASALEAGVSVRFKEPAGGHCECACASVGAGVLLTATCVVPQLNAPGPPVARPACWWWECVPQQLQPRWRTFAAT